MPRSQNAYYKTKTKQKTHSGKSAGGNAVDPLVIGGSAAVGGSPILPVDGRSSIGQ